MAIDTFPISFPTISGAASLCLVFVPVLFFSLSRASGSAQRTGGKRPTLELHKHEKPPSVTFAIPVLVGLLFKPMNTLMNSSWFARKSPFRINLFFMNIVFNLGPENAAALLADKSLSAYFFHAAILHNIFGLSKTGKKAYAADNSGPGRKPFPGTNVPPNCRIEHTAFKRHHEFLIGAGLPSLHKRYNDSFTRRIAAFRSHVRNGEVSDGSLLYLVKNVLMGPALIDAVLAPAVLDRDPDFLENFWVIDDTSITMASGLPRRLVPKAHTALRKCLDTITGWHAWARKNSDPHEDIETQDDPFWGSKFIRERQLTGDIDGMTLRDLASQDLALAWGATHNTVRSLFWLIVDVFGRPHLLQHIKDEAKTCIIGQTEDGLPLFDTARLIRQPYIQAAYAETLRLRTHSYIVRHVKQSVNIKDWQIPDGSFVTIPTTPAHMDTEEWAKAERGSHPVSLYAPERFFISTEEATGPSFSLSGVDGRSWLPFGGGAWVCPGRHFAKQQTLTALATLAIIFDIELRVGDSVGMSSGRFGFGILDPSSTVSFCIRAL